MHQIELKKTKEETKLVDSEARQDHGQQNLTKDKHQSTKHNTETKS